MSLWGHFTFITGLFSVWRYYKISHLEAICHFLPCSFFPFPHTCLSVPEYLVGVIQCTCDHLWLSAYLYLCVWYRDRLKLLSLPRKLTLTFSHPAQECIQGGGGYFIVRAFIWERCWALGKPPYKSPCSICCIKPTKAFLVCWAGKGPP